MGKDHLSFLQADPEDATQHGIKGMKWGVRRSSSELRSAKKAKKDHVKAAVGEAMKKAESGGHAAELGLNAGVKAVKEFDAAQKKGNIQDHVESSSDRYDRIAAQAKSGQASKLTEQDLKFFNARTEALNKVAKMYETEPSWLQQTAKKVIQQTAEKQIQNIADTVANKYVSGNILDALGAGKQVKEVAKAASGDKKSGAAVLASAAKTLTQAKADLADPKPPSGDVGPTARISGTVAEGPSGYRPGQGAATTRIVSEQEFNTRLEAAQKQKNARIAGLFGPIEK